MQTLKRGNPQCANTEGFDGTVKCEPNDMTKDTTLIHQDTHLGAQIMPFRGNKLLLVDHEGQPYVPMKPVVEGMGLDWKSQHRKLAIGRFESTMVEMTIVAQDGKRRSMACLSLRKLPGWLMSINAGKVRESIREQVMAYQAECDDVLWAYWNEGHAINPRENPNIGSILNQTIGTDGFHCLAAVLDGKLRSLKGGSKRAAKNHMWQQVHKAFSVVSAEDIQASQMDAARNFIAAYALEGEWLPAAPVTEYDYPVARWLKMNPVLAAAQVFAGKLTVPVGAVTAGNGAASPIRETLNRLKSDGHDVEAAICELDALQHHLWRYQSLARRIQDGIAEMTGPYKAHVTNLRAVGA